MSLNRVQPSTFHMPVHMPNNLVTTTRMVLQENTLHRRAQRESVASRLNSAHDETRCVRAGPDYHVPRGESGVTRCLLTA